jgi:electron transport complex protein RnfD
MSRKFDTGVAPYFPPQSTVAGVMRQVLYALLPGIIAYTWFFGPGILVQILLAVIFALLFETLMLKARKQPLKPFLGDWSAVVTAVLFALCLPPLAPWWVALVGMLFAIVVAKHLYGGLGQNMFNPAMVGYVVVLISFPFPRPHRWMQSVPVSHPATWCPKPGNHLFSGILVVWVGNGSRTCMRLVDSGCCGAGSSVGMCR